MGDPEGEIPAFEELFVLEYLGESIEWPLIKCICLFLYNSAKDAQRGPNTCPSLLATNLNKTATTYNPDQK